MICKVVEAVRMLPEAHTPRSRDHLRAWIYDRKLPSCEHAYVICLRGNERLM
jgi:hypothetical protein